MVPPPLKKGGASPTRKDPEMEALVLGGELMRIVVGGLILGFILLQRALLKGVAERQTLG
jgi:hypothetical protein